MHRLFGRKGKYATTPNIDPNYFVDPLQRETADPGESNKKTTKIIVWIR